MGKVLLDKETESGAKMRKSIAAPVMEGVDVSTKQSILIVEDSFLISTDLAQKVTAAGYEVAGILGSADEIVDKVALLNPSLVLMDIRLEGKIDGIKATAALRKESDVPVIILTAHYDEQNITEAAQCGANGYLLKPYEDRTLLANMKLVLAQQSKNEKANYYYNIKLKKAFKELELSRQKLSESINYAQRIQKSILPTEQKVQQIFPESFILHKAKDVISGDFPWLFHDGDTVIISAVDCTGHGVPGAMMSMIGFFLLQQIVEASFIHQPGAILDCLHMGVVHTLKQEENLESRDGMDVALCNINLNSMELQFAGAHRGLIHIRKGELTEIKGSRFPIGGVHYARKGKTVKFTNEKLQLERGDCIYFYSDGYPDQMGGPEGFKFMNKKIRELLGANWDKPMAEQKQILSDEFENWKGDLKQLDDVLFIGIKI